MKCLDCGTPYVETIDFCPWCAGSGDGPDLWRCRECEGTGNVLEPDCDCEYENGYEGDDE